MKIIEKKRISDSVIIAKTKLLQLTNNVSNLVSLVGFSSILLPVPEKLKYIFYVFIICCLIYSSIYGNDTALKIIEARKEKGDLFDKNLINTEILVKLTRDEFKTLKDK